MSEEYVIDLYNISKVYKLFKSKKSKILDILGFTSEDYEKFWVLKDINLHVRRGEKIGIIGKNGAGKTTLLNIIAKNIKPTSGEIYIQGKITALFSLGTGFHPEFTGAENILSSLAYQGITGRKAQELKAEIIDFSELDDFIDQPVKIYSGGMYSRLAFAVATAVKPEILIVDEILGAGDTYFNAKAMERMNELTTGGATVLFVSHDLSSVQKMCGRVIWIRKGKIQKDGNPLETIKAYSFYIRQKQELRLQAGNLKSAGTILKHNGDKEQLLIRFIGEDGLLPKTGIPVRRLTLFYKDKTVAEINVGDAMDNDYKGNAYLIIDKDKINWSEPYKFDGQWVRAAQDRGGAFKHAVAVFNIPKGLEKNKLFFKIKYFNLNSRPILIQLFEKDKYITLTEMNSDRKGWIEKEFGLPCAHTDYCRSCHADQNLVTKNVDSYGSGEIKITKFEILDKEKKEKYVFTIGDIVFFRIHFQKESKEFTASDIAFVITIYDLKGTCISQIISKEKGIYIKQIPSKGIVEVKISCLRIGRGDFLISVGIFKDINLFDPKEQNAFWVEDRKYRIKVKQPWNIHMDLGLVYQKVHFKFSWKDGLYSR